MTVQEAIERLQCMKLFMQINDKDNESKFLDEDYEANAIAIKALEKQIPKKPKKLIPYDMDIGFEVIHTQRGFCSSCVQSVIEEKHDFCPRCGVAIKWDD